ncbi:Heterokaryon incompatibility protein s [Colletotrichum sp. SAR11_240]|nr:Heterokaryon incompatibility protein s [Colletotrichum sp. SAR11_240]
MVDEDKEHDLEILDAIQELEKSDKPLEGLIDVSGGIGTRLEDEHTNNFDAKSASMTFTGLRTEDSENTIAGHEYAFDKDVTLAMLKNRG